jgi:hypothetical protein
MKGRVIMNNEIELKEEERTKCEVYSRVMGKV